MPFVSPQDSITAQPYSEEDHRRMDRAVSEYLAALEWRPLPNPSKGELAGVLHAVILGDDRLDRSHSRLDLALTLVDKHPWLRSKLADAWRSGTYHDIRNLGMHAIHGWSFFTS